MVNSEGDQSEDDEEDDDNNGYHVVLFHDCGLVWCLWGGGMKDAG